MISDLTTYKAYFQSLATALGCSFVYANKRRLLDQQSSQLTYPVMWVPVPEVTLDRSGNDAYVFKGAAVFVTDVAVDDYAGQDLTLATMLEKARRAVAQMAVDAEGQFVFDPEQVEFEHVTFWTADNDFGWKIEFEIGGATLCC